MSIVSPSIESPTTYIIFRRLFLIWPSASGIAEQQEVQTVGGLLSIIGHYAGRWQARVYTEEFTQANISLLLTLGSHVINFTTVKRTCMKSTFTQVQCFYGNKDTWFGMLV